jgi:hypothetical protein
MLRREEFRLSWFQYRYLYVIIAQGLDHTLASKRVFPLIRAILYCLLLFGSNLFVFGQQENPFELKNRIPRKSVPTSDTLIQSPEPVTSTATVDSALFFNKDSMAAADGVKPDTMPVPLPLEERLVETADTTSSTLMGVETDKEKRVSKALSNPKTPLVKPSGLAGQLDKLPLSADLELENRSIYLGASILILLLLTSLLAVNRALVRKAYRAIANDNYLRFLYREYKTMPWLYWLFYLHFFLNAGFFTYMFLDFYNWYEGSSVLVLLLCILLVMGTYLLKHLSLGTIASAFPVEKEASLYGFVTILVNILLGLALLPINLLIAFGPESLVIMTLWTGISLVVLLYFFRQLKGLFISGRLVRSYLFHFFLYLCSAEIAPLLIVGKLALGNFEY